MAKKIEKKPDIKKEEHKSALSQVPVLPARLVQVIAEEVARNVIIHFPGPRRNPKKKKNEKILNAIFLDTSAIIDGRVFDVINMKVLVGTFVIPESILLELKHIADSQDMVKRERGRKGLALLDRLKKTRGIKVMHLSERNGDGSPKEVDDKLISLTKVYKGRLVTCDFNLEKKASISGVIAININTLANHLKIKAVPGEALHIRVLHQGKDPTQGIGYLDDGTMLVVENAALDIGKAVDVIVSRVIQTTAGRILFSRKI